MIWSDRPLFYVEDLQPDEIDLPEEEVAHANVLRLEVGSPVVLSDGRGGGRLASITSTSRRNVIARVEGSLFADPAGADYIDLSFGLLSVRSRLEWLVEKVTEIGVRRIIPLETERSEGRFKQDRVSRVIIAASKQSQRLTIPILEEPMSLSRLVRELDESRFLVCHEGAGLENSLTRVLRNGERAGVHLSIGPEGGFSESEIEQLGAVRNARIVSLGTRRLRSETAAVAACAAAMLVRSEREFAEERFR